MVRNNRECCYGGPRESGVPAEIFFKIVTHVEIDNVELGRLHIKSGDS